MEKKIRIAVDGTEGFNRIMDEFNRSYKTDFVLEHTDFVDGTEFVFVTFEKATLDDVFCLGYHYNTSFLHRGTRVAPDVFQ